MEVNEMDAPKKVTDFIKLDAGNIGRKSAVVTGAALASGVLGAALLSQMAEAGDHCDCHYNNKCCWHRPNCDVRCHHDDGHWD
jgi:hypothetical protein